VESGTPRPRVAHQQTLALVSPPKPVALLRSQVWPCRVKREEMLQKEEKEARRKGRRGGGSLAWGQCEGPALIWGKDRNSC
jgi:hypothetical protein